LPVFDIDVLPLEIGAAAYGTAPLPVLDRVKPYSYKGPPLAFLILPIIGRPDRGGLDVSGHQLDDSLMGPMPSLAGRRAFGIR